MLAEAASWAYLAGSLVGLAFTLNAFFPSRGRRALVWSFFASMITIELAAHHLFWQLAAAAAFIALGVLETLAGRVALGLSVASWIGLLYLVVRGAGARAEMRQALEGFVRDVHGPRIPLVKLMMPFPAARKEVRLTRDVVYKKIAGRRLKLDVYEPLDKARDRPAVIQIHGGAWVVGDKREQGVPLCMHLAANGWVAFNVNYRLSPGATFPDHLVDLKEALAWVRQHAPDYGIDPGFVAVTGGSAGGHLTALLALTENDPRYQPGFEGADTRVQAAVPFYGVYDLTNRFGTMPKELIVRLLQPHVMKAYLDEDPQAYSLASPIDRVRADAPPFLVIHGSHDTLAPLFDARQFVERLGAVSNQPVLYAELRGAQHAFDLFASPRSAPVIEGVERFLSEVRRRHLLERRGARPHEPGRRPATAADAPAPEAPRDESQ